MKRLNCIVVIDQQRKDILFCKRMKDPYKGLYNFPGGKVEEGESSLAAAYRELQEETGIGRDKIKLYHLMDFTYYAEAFVLEIYVGQLGEEITLVEETNPLIWMPLTEDFADTEKYAGDKNIAHIVSKALQFSLEKTTNIEIDSTKISIGIDGCKGGWIVSIIENGLLTIKKYATLEEITRKIPFDGCLIDMIIGLKGKNTDIRPESEARHEMKGRASTIFPSPCRAAIYGETKAERLVINEEILGKKFTSQTDAIIPKIKEVDIFLQSNPTYKNVIMESHPEVCFARLNGQVLASSKHTDEGIKDRAKVLSEYFEEVTFEDIKKKAKLLACNMDDITDSICLSIVSNLECQGKTETIPEKPMKDETDLLMQMVVPKKQG